jgi:hypothetical protein
MSVRVMDLMTSVSCLVFVVLDLECIIVEWAASHTHRQFHTDIYIQRRAKGYESCCEARWKRSYTEKRRPILESGCTAIDYTCKIH